MSAADAPLVLIVDDERIVCDVTEAVLTRAGLRVLCASGALEGLALFELHQKEIGVVLLDRSMPELDGLTVLGRMRALRSELPAILSSGIGGTPGEAAAIPGPAPRLLLKPYRAAALLEMVRDALRTS